MGERESFPLRFPVDAIEVDEELGCVTVRLTHDELRRLIPVLVAGLERLEPIVVPVMGGEG